MFGCIRLHYVRTHWHFIGSVQHNYNTGCHQHPIAAIDSTPISIIVIKRISTIIVMSQLLRPLTSLQQAVLIAALLCEYIICIVFAFLFV